MITVAGLFDKLPARLNVESFFFILSKPPGVRLPFSSVAFGLGVVSLVSLARAWLISFWFLGALKLGYREKGIERQQKIVFASL